MTSVRFYNFQSVERVRIGIGSSLIKVVTREKVEYTDEAGREMDVDLDECALTYLCLYYAGQFPPRDDTDWSKVADAFPGRAAIDASRETCVGLRGALDDPAWFQFLNRRRTQFEFTDYGHIRSALIEPLGRAGRNSYDGC